MEAEKPELEVDMSPQDGHPDWNDLAALAEGNQSASVDLQRHLASCRRCTAAYAEAVRLRTLELVAPASFEVAPAMIEAARQTGPAGQRRWSRRPRLTGVFAGATLAALALFAIMIRPGATPPPPAFAAIQAALLEQAPAGMVLPGLSPEQGRAQAIYRDGGAGDLRKELEILANHQQQDPGADTSFWLAAGYLAAGRLQSATDLVREARRHHPDDLRLLTLDAVTSYRRSDLGRAETLLREVLVRDPDHAAARFNLALVLQETGCGGEARRLLERNPWADDPWLANRAAVLRDTLR